jgi:hypothetical protein
MSNSVKQVIAYLQENPFTSENQIMSTVFGYTRRSRCSGSNKKYAELLRRGLDSGKIARIEAKVSGKLDKFFYYVPKKKATKAK